MGRFVMSPEKFKTLEADAKHSDKITDLRMTGEYSGIVDTHDASIEFNYDLGTQALNFVVGKKHSLAAKMASDNVIERHITEVLFNLESAPQVKGAGTEFAKQSEPVKTADPVTTQQKPNPVAVSAAQTPGVKPPVPQNK